MQKFFYILHLRKRIVVSAETSLINKGKLFFFLLKVFNYRKIPKSKAQELSKIGRNIPQPSWSRFTAPKDCENENVL